MKDSLRQSRTKSKTGVMLSLLTNQFGLSEQEKLPPQTRLRKSMITSELGSRRTYLHRLQIKQEFFMVVQSLRKMQQSLSKREILMGSLLEELHLRKPSLILLRLAMMPRNEI